MLFSNPPNHEVGKGKKQRHSHSKMSEGTKCLEKHILQCLCMAAGMAGPPQGPEWTGRRRERVRRSEGFSTGSSTGVLGYCTSIGDCPHAAHLGRRPRELWELPLL